MCSHRNSSISTVSVEKEGKLHHIRTTRFKQHNCWWAIRTCVHKMPLSMPLSTDQWSLCIPGHMTSLIHISKLALWHSNWYVTKKNTVIYMHVSTHSYLHSQNHPEYLMITFWPVDFFFFKYIREILIRNTPTFSTHFVNLWLIYKSFS